MNCWMKYKFAKLKCSLKMWLFNCITVLVVSPQVNSLPPAALGVLRLASRFSRLKQDPVFRASSRLSITPSWLSSARQVIESVKKNTPQVLFDQLIC